MALKGKYIVIRDGTVVISSARSCIIRHSCKLERQLHPDSTAPEQIVMRKSWQITLNKLQKYNPGFDIMKVGKEVNIVVVEDGQVAIDSQAICTKYLVDARHGALVQGSFVYEGKGDLV